MAHHEQHRVSGGDVHDVIVPEQKCDGAPECEGDEAAAVGRIRIPPRQPHGDDRNNHLRRVVEPRINRHCHDGGNERGGGVAGRTERQTAGENRGEGQQQDAEQDVHEQRRAEERCRHR